MKKKIIALISGAVILIIAAGSIYGKFESSHKEGEPDVVGTFSVNRDENITVVANREDIEDREAFARKLLQMYKDDSFHSTKFSTDRGYATSLDMNIYLWKMFLLHPVHLSYDRIQFSHKYFLQQLSRSLLLLSLQLSFSSYFH